MATQANITLTVLAQEDGLLPDIPVRKLTLNHPGDFKILGRASIKEPKSRKDGCMNKKTVSRIAAVDNGYISRNETIAGEHAALCLKQDGEVYLEHKAGRFPPTFVNGIQIHKSVQVENNDIINLGPLKAYTSKHKNRTYQPFAFKLNIAFKYKVLTLDEDSSSSEEELDHAMSDLCAPTPSPLESSQPSTIRQREVIDVSSSDDEDSSSTHDDDIYEATPLHQSSQQSQDHNETVIIDLTESEEGPGVYTPWKSSISTQISYALDDSSSSDDETDDEVDKENTECLHDEMDSDEFDDSTFGDDASDAPSEEPIERSQVSGPFSRGFRLDYSPEPELLTSDMDIGLGSELDSDASDIEGDYDDLFPLPIPEQQIPAAHPHLSEHLRKFQEDERVRLDNKEREEDRDRSDEIAARYKRAEDMERDESLVKKADRWKTGMERERADREKMEMGMKFEEEKKALHQLVQKRGETMQIQADAMTTASQRETSKNLASQEGGPQHKMNDQPAQIPYSALLGGSQTPTDPIQVMSDIGMGHRQPVTPPQQLPAQQPEEIPPITLGAKTIGYPELDKNIDTNFGAEYGFQCYSYGPATGAVPEKSSNPVTFAPRMESAELPLAAHTTTDYMAARAENRAKLMFVTQQPTPPSLFMSGSLFGQALEAGMQLPALPVKNPNAMSSLQSELVTTESDKKWFDETTGTWMGSRRMRPLAKVSIKDLLEREEVAYDYTEEEDFGDNCGEDADMEDVEEPVVTKIADGWAQPKPIVTEGPVRTAAVQAVLMTNTETTPQTTKKQKTEITKSQEPSAESAFASYAEIANTFEPVSKAPVEQFAIQEQANNAKPTLQDSSRAVFEAVSQAGSTTKDKGPKKAAPKTEIENKKRKHVEFEDISTVIPPPALTISSILSHGVIENSASINKPSADSVDFTMTSTSSSPRNGPVKHVHFDQPIAQLLEERVLATPVRPSKRLKTVKKVAERLGYATLGAVAAGAGLFAALVASAPEEF